MPDPIFDSALLSMCMTWRHDFGLLDRKEQMAVKRELLGLYKHHVKPAIDRASSAESSLAAMRQRAVAAERQRDGYKNACNDVIGEMLAKDEQDRIGQHIAGLLSYTMIVQALPSGMVNAQALRKAVEAWREARKSVKADDISTVSSYRAERDAAIVRAERAEDALEDIKTTIEDQLDESPHGDDHVNCFLENLKMKANAALSSPPADATKMGGGRERRLADSLDEILNYSGGADNALEDEYVMERAIAALADMEQKPTPYIQEPWGGPEGGGVIMEQIKPDYIQDRDAKEESVETMETREHYKEEIKKALDDVMREVLITNITTQLATYRTALEHIRDGHDIICPDCGWVGDTPYKQYDSQSGGAGGGLIARLCPSCHGGDLLDGADGIAAYALAQAEKVE